MNFKSNSFLACYIFIVFLDLLFGWLDFHEFRLLTKPLVVISLMIYFGINGKHLPPKIYAFTVLAMCFSLVGDVLLLFDERKPKFFLFGLMAFMLAHLSYTFVFLRQRNTRFSRESWFVLTVLIIYIIVLFFMIKNNLDGLIIPVVIYIIAILAMAISSQNRMGKVSNQSYILVLSGALIYILSDSIFAIDRFYHPILWAQLWVMGTYATSQYLIINGLLSNK